MSYKVLFVKKKTPKVQSWCGLHFNYMVMVVKYITMSFASHWLIVSHSVLPRLLLQGAAPCPLFVTPCPFEKAEMTPCPFD